MDEKTLKSLYREFYVAECNLDRKPACFSSLNESVDLEMEKVRVDILKEKYLMARAQYIQETIDNYKQREDFLGRENER